jgi:peptidoglycan/xylan/chitin deacetylase (PgdA/CDA1 family)
MAHRLEYPPELNTLMPQGFPESLLIPAVTAVKQPPMSRFLSPLLPILVCLIVGFTQTTPAAGLEPGKLYTRGSSDQKTIAISFDDGPGPETPRLLEILDRYHVKATFFVLGEAAQTRQNTLKDISKRGHEIASHTTSHRNYAQYLKSLSASQPAATAESKATRDLVADMQETHQTIANITGTPPFLCRMPHGIDRPWIKTAARKMGYALVNWTYGADWQPDPASKLLPGYINAVRPGAILLFHDGGRNRAKSFELAEAVIQHAQQEGYSIVTVGEILGAQTSHWKRDFQVSSSTR